MLQTKERLKIKLQNLKQKPSAPTRKEDKNLLNFKLYARTNFGAIKRIVNMF